MMLVRQPYDSYPEMSHWKKKVLKYNELGNSRQKLMHDGMSHG